MTNKLGLVLLAILAVTTPASIWLLREKSHVAVPNMLRAISNSTGNKMIELYEIRLESAKLSLESSKLDEKHAKYRHDDALKLQKKGAISFEEARQRKLDYDHAALDARYNDLAVKAAEAQLSLIKQGTADGSLGLDDLTFPTDPSTKHVK